MLSGQLCIDDAMDPALALGRAYVVCDAVSSDAPLAIYGASLRGEALVLGAYQRAQDALRPRTTTGPDATRVLRRRSGGITVRAGDGIVYVAIGLHERSSLMPCPPNRILNRNVRGALAGLRLLGVPAHYFGRDFISVDSKPCVFVGWNATPSGHVLLELFIAERSAYLPEASLLGYPPREADPLRSKQAITLEQAGARALGSEVVRRIAAGYASAASTGLELHETTLDANAQARAQAIAAELEPQDVAARDAQLSWSSPRDEAIGFVSAGLRLDGSGKVSALRLAGDFFQDSGCQAALERTLLGVEPSAENFGRALDTVYARSGHELEGVRTLESFREALLDAAACAHGALDLAREHT